MRHSLIAGLVIALIPLVPARAQDAASHVARGDSAYALFDGEVALAQYDSALALDSLHADALGKASRTAIDIGESLTDAARQKELYRTGERHARRAVQVDSANAEQWFHLARALGRTALSMGVRDRVRYAVEIRRCAERALAINPDHPGALHVLGMWNAEVKRLSGVELFFARRFLGGGLLGQANWKDAVAYMERAVAVDPDRIVHQLDLAGVYSDTGERDKARALYEAVVASTKRVDYSDPLHRQQAAERLKRLR